MVFRATIQGERAAVIDQVTPVCPLWGLARGERVALLLVVATLSCAFACEGFAPT
jgi:hypothetical protein